MSYRDILPILLSQHALLYMSSFQKGSGSAMFSALHSVLPNPRRSGLSLSILSFTRHHRKTSPALAFISHQRKARCRVYETLHIQLTVPKDFSAALTALRRNYSRASTYILRIAETELVHMAALHVGSAAGLMSLDVFVSLFGLLWRWQHGSQ